MGPDMLIATIAIFITVAVATGGAATWILERNTPERRRIRALGAPASSSGVVATTSVVESEIDPLLAKLSRLMPKSPQDMNLLQRRMIRAGYAGPNAAAWFVVAQIALPLSLATAIVLVGGLGLWPLALFGAAVGYAAPTFYIARKTKLRQKAIVNGLPDALDLLTVCVEAGGALDQAIVRTSEELAIAHPALAEELRLITTETRAGKPRVDAFKNFAKRTGVDEVRTLVGMLTQTDRFGTSVAQALRTHADTSRTKRRQRAEERAGKVGVKLVFPLALCLFPALYVVCFGPVVIKIYRAFFTGAL